MLYSARKHKKQPAHGSCLAIKHIYTMMSMAVPNLCFRLQGQTMWNLVNAKADKQHTDLYSRKSYFSVRHVAVRVHSIYSYLQ